MTSDVVMIPTVAGEVRSDELGVTLMHEHIFILSPELEQNYPEGWQEEERVADAITKLQAAKNGGVDTVVDLTVLGLGRYIPRIQRIAEQVDINIIVATGAYITTALPLQFMFQDPAGPLGKREVLIDMFEQDAAKGISDTGVRAAIIKCATDHAGLTPDVERVLRAAARVQRGTNLPIFTHTEAETRRGLDQLRIFAAEGVDPQSVIIGHSGDTGDLDYLRELLAAGSYLGMDRFGLYNILDYETRLDTVANLCTEGYSSRLLLSHDTSCYFRWDAELRSLAPQWHYTHLIEDVLPDLRRRGVSQGQIDEMMVVNPRRIFESNHLCVAREESS
ncbi:MAG TPA: phosphotriesterase-related protein [Streptosporangiaceae bacterium]|nr:phosphotriesterase-related protein [Streptosporangiaceae bacterium]